MSNSIEMDEINDHLAPNVAKAELEKSQMKPESAEKLTTFFN